MWWTITGALLVISYTSGYSEPAASQLHKAVLTQKGYIQFLKYKVDVPPLSQFTFCVWLKSYNLTHSHPILSYSQHERDRLLRVWLSPGGKWLRAKLLEQDVSSTRVDIKENKWIHICHSWHSLTSKWQLYINGQLRAQGTAEKLRDIIIPGGGDLVIGQEYTDFNKGLDEGVEGELFGFNMVLSSTTEAGNHKYFNRQESRDSFSTLSLDGDTADIQNDYIRLADINYDDDFNKEKEKHNNRKPLYVAPQNFNFRNVKDNNDQVLDIEQHADAPIEISHAPPLQLYKEPEPGAVLKPPSTFSSQWSAYLPPGLPEEPLRSTYEVEYSKRNFHGNEWYDQNRYYPKELIRQNNHHRNHRGKGKKTQAQKEISLIETSELYPYPSENDFAYIKDIPGIPIERSHTVSKRELIEGDKNIQILNPESVIVYPRKSDVVNVGVYPRSNLQSVGEQERTAVVIALRQEETESGDAEESKIHPRPFSLSTQDVDTVNGDASKPSFEVLYSQNHYTGPNNSTRTFDKGPYTVDIGTSHSEDLPRFVNHQIPFPQPHFVQENYYKDQLPNPYNNIIFKKYPQSINDKLNNDDIEHSQFRKAVKLGNALNELQIFKQHGNSRDNSFINSNNRVPDIIKYRSDIDKNDEERRFQYRFNDINLNAQRPITQIRHEINTAQIPESAGRKLVELSYRKCLLGKGSPLSGDGLSLVSWTLTPVKMFGGVGLKIANPSCGLF